MDSELAEKLAMAAWVGKSLFERGKVTGATGNISFKHDSKLYMSVSGSSFGRITEESFVCLGIAEYNKRPSKEYPLHQLLYEYKAAADAVIHTHSLYATLWSCLAHGKVDDIMPAYTPYLKMRIGKIGIIPYAKPGSTELFANFAAGLNKNDGYLLANHGPIVSGKDLLDAFYNIEELEESAKIAWLLRQEALARRI